MLTAYHDPSLGSPSLLECLCSTRWCPHAENSHSRTCYRPTPSTLWKPQPGWRQAPAPRGRLQNTNTQVGFHGHKQTTWLNHMLDCVHICTVMIPATGWLCSSTCWKGCKSVWFNTYWSWSSRQPGPPWCLGRSHLLPPCLGQASGIGCARQYPQASPFSHEPLWSWLPREQWGCLLIAWRRRKHRNEWMKETWQNWDKLNSKNQGKRSGPSSNWTYLMTPSSM